MSFLERITEQRRADAVARRQQGALEVAKQNAPGAARPVDFGAALTKPGLALVAEIKRSSPSKGPINVYANSAMVAEAFVAGGADAISVLTEPSIFGGSLDDLRRVRTAVSLPLLRKDFICDPLHVWEARAAGADAVLLIVGALTQTELVSLIDLTESLGMAADVEVHSEEEISRGIDAGAKLMAINARDLSSLDVNIETIEKIRPLIPEGIVTVAESGIETRADVERMRATGVDAIHVGETLMRAEDPAAKIRELLGD